MLSASDRESLIQPPESVAPVWQNYWMAISGIPSVAAVDEIIGIYFSEVNWYV